MSEVKNMENRTEKGMGQHIRACLRPAKRRAAMAGFAAVWGVSLAGGASAQSFAAQPKTVPTVQAESFAQGLSAQEHSVNDDTPALMQLALDASAWFDDAIAAAGQGDVTAIVSVVVCAILAFLVVIGLRFLVSKMGLLRGEAGGFLDDLGL